MELIQHYYLPRLVGATETLSQDSPVPDSLQLHLVSLKDHIDASYARPEGMYSKVRKMIASRVQHIGVNAAARETIRQTKDEYEIAKKAAMAVTEKRNRHQTVISMKYILDVVDRLKGGHTFGDMVLLLMLSCGARKIELLDEETSQFSSDDPKFITQRGFAKKSAASSTHTLTKPLLFIAADVFLVMLQYARLVVATREKKDKESIGKSFSHQLEKLSAHFWPQNTANGYRTGTHINRAIYANVAYRKFRAPNESLTHFVKVQLGHESMGTAANYMNVSIAFDTDEDLMEEAERQAEVLEDAKVPLENEDGEIELFLPPPCRKMTKEERMSVAYDFAEQLDKKGVKVNRANLMALGLQSRIITASGVLDAFKE